MLVEIRKTANKDHYYFFVAKQIITHLKPARLVVLKQMVSTIGVKS